MTRNEVLVAKTTGPSTAWPSSWSTPAGAEFDEVRYLVDPFAGEADPSFDVTKVVYVWRRLWDRGGAPG